MKEQFSRTKLLLGSDAMNTLKNSSVLVFGIGGVGGYVVEVLARSGVGYSRRTHKRYKSKLCSKEVSDILPS